MPRKVIFAVEERADFLEKIKFIQQKRQINCKICKNSDNSIKPSAQNLFVGVIPHRSMTFAAWGDLKNSINSAAAPF